MGVVRRKLQIGEVIDHVTIKSCRRVETGVLSYIVWSCECRCGNVREMRTNVIRMVRRFPLSCGCAGYGRRKPKLQLQHGRKQSDPTPLEIAEECLAIHMEADRQPPLMLMQRLRALRSN